MFKRVQMAGVKGRSGGARPNSGPRPKKLTVKASDPLEFLEAVMRDDDADPQLRVRAAIAAAQYRHPKKGEGGKGEDKKRAAKDAGGGKFAPAPPPLRLVNSE